jgi:3-deoxy-D-manno-octulosonic-acid transferase
MLEMVELLAVQTPEDKRRFVELGADESKIKVTGNLKFDFALPAADPASGLLAGIREVLSLEEKNPVIVIGSTMKGEEIHFLEAFRNVAAAVPGARMILAPRHPERFDEVAELIGRSGAPFCRRSRLEKVQRNAKAQILLLDSIGELRTVYAIASIAVIGGSFLPFGGHNLLEPAALGKAIIFGPEMSNFKEMAALFLREKSARRCSLPELPGTLAELLANESARSLLGQRAAATCRRNQGATETTAVLLQPYIRTVGAHV